MVDGVEGRNFDPVIKLSRSILVFLAGMIAYPVHRKRCRISISGNGACFAKCLC